MRRSEQRRRLTVATGAPRGRRSRPWVVEPRPPPRRFCRGALAGASPPGVRQADRHIHLGGAVILRETEKRNVTVAPHQVPAALTAVVMPDAFLPGRRAPGAVSGVARAMPRPVSLNDFGGRLPRDLAGLDGRAARRP